MTVSKLRFLSWRLFFKYVSVSVNRCTEASRLVGAEYFCRCPPRASDFHRAAMFFFPVAWRCNASLMSVKAIVRMSSNLPVTPPLARLPVSECNRVSARLSPMVQSCVAEKPAGGCRTLASHTVLDGGAHASQAESDDGSVLEIVLAFPCWNTAPKSPMALPVNACAVVPCSAK